MGQTRVNTPDGEITIQHPDDASESEILIEAERLYNARKQDETDPSAFGPRENFPEPAFNTLLRQTGQLGNEFLSNIFGGLGGALPAVQSIGRGSKEQLIGGSDPDAPENAADRIRRIGPEASQFIDQITLGALGSPENDREIGFRERQIGDAIRAPFAGLHKVTQEVGDRAFNMAETLPQFRELAPEIATAAETAAGLAPLGGTRLGPRTPRQQVAFRGQESGFVVPRAEVARDRGRLGERIVGKDINEQASIRNTANAQSLIREQLGMQNDTPLSARELSLYRGRQFDSGYAPIRAIDRAIEITPRAAEAIRSATSPLRGVERASEGISKSRSAIEQLGNLSKTTGTSASTMLDLLRQLRENADIAFDKGKSGQATVWRNAARALEDALETSLGRMEVAGIVEPGLMSGFRNARRNIAISHSVQDALLQPNGSVVSMQKLGSSQEPLTGNLALIAEFAREFPNVSQVIDTSLIKEMSMFEGSLLATGGAVTVGSGAVSGNPALAAAGLVPLTMAAAKPALRGSILGPIGQFNATMRPIQRFPQSAALTGLIASQQPTR
jgi:hypothetical protein